MSIILRPYQTRMKQDIYSAWDSGAQVVGACMPTGSGKTVVFSDIVREVKAPTIQIAHRQELVSQISLALAANEVPHRIIAQKKTIHNIVRLHGRKFGRSFYDPTSIHAVGGVDTLIRRGSELANYLPQVRVFVGDEGHHFLQSNKWGKACAMFPNARGLLVSATFHRADGQGLGRHADGLVDKLIYGPTMRELIDDGYLTDYRIFAPPSDLDLDGVTVTTQSGEFSPTQLKTRVERAHLVGDVVEHYLRLARGKLGITFAIDIEEAEKYAAAYNAAGVPAAVITSKTPDAERYRAQELFERRELLQLVNVDIFGEGYDVPALEVVSMARATQSLCLFLQQFGRALRPMPGKDHALIIDHVGNIARHGLPDRPRVWSLDRVDKRKKKEPDPDAIPIKTCKACAGAYEAIYKICPYCGAEDIPGGRVKPEQVDGDLIELTAETLAEMRKDITKVDRPAHQVREGLERAGHHAKVSGGAAKRHDERKKAQSILRINISYYAGVHQSLGRPSSEIYKRFYFLFGVDIMTAQTLGKTPAIELLRKIHTEIFRLMLKHYGQPAAEDYRGRLLMATLDAQVRDYKAIDARNN